MVAVHRGYKTYRPGMLKLAERMGIAGCKLIEVSTLEGAKLGSLHKAKSLRSVNGVVGQNGLQMAPRLHNTAG